MERIRRQGIAHDPLQCWQRRREALSGPQDRGDALGVRAQEENGGDGRGGTQEAGGQDLQSLLFPLILPSLLAGFPSSFTAPGDTGQINDVPQMPSRTAVGLQVSQQPITPFLPARANHSSSSPAGLPVASPVPFSPLQYRQQQAPQR